MSCKSMRRALALAVLAFVLPAAPAQAERDMFIVGSTFLAPYVETVVGALVGRKVINPPRTAFGGTGAGVAQFCASAALSAPDVVAMSRRMRTAELETCVENGVGGVIEIQLGLSAVSLAARRDDADFSMSLDAFYRAVAAELPKDTEFLPNANSNWNEVHGTLPELPIRVMVPAPGLGSRGFFEDRFLQSACRDVFEIKTIVVAAERVEQCIGLRKDGRIGEISIPYDVNLRKTMQEAPIGTVAIAPLNMAKEMLDVVRVLAFDGAAPTQENIASRTYQL
ncbi:MAG: substrate-binding domain-containing protein, partial [Proteobacteria bacterium]|nr:substrate-binding domain-containing protein [Pseudomonadota bacterium]